MGVTLEEFEALQPRKMCWHQRLTTEQREKVQAAHEAGYSLRTIATVVSRWGIPVARSTVGAHFRGECQCQN
jgi:IS30 family transposase